MITQYCVHSASALGDTVSCACVAYTANQKYYASCTDYGVDCAGQARFIVAANSNTTAGYELLTDYVCGNVFCSQARYGSQSFITAGLLERALSCPQNICTMIRMGSSVTINDIEAGAYYIADASLKCDRSSVSETQPTYSDLLFTNVWFYDSVKQEILNPDTQGILGVTNTGNSDFSMTVMWDGALNLTQNRGLPDWLYFSGIDLNEFILANHEYNISFGIVPSKIHSSLQFQLPVTISDQRYTDFKIISKILFQVVDIASKQPPGPPPTPIIPKKISQILGRGAWSLAGASVLLFLMTIYLFFVIIRARKISV